MPSAVARHRTACERGWMQKGRIGFAYSCHETPDGMRERVDAARRHRVCLQLSRDTGRCTREHKCSKDAWGMPSAVARHRTACEREKMQKGRIGFAYSCRETPDGMRERADAERTHRVCFQLSRERERADAKRTHRVCLQLSRDTGRHARESGCSKDA
jgi:hypothetical protein